MKPLVSVVVPIYNVSMYLNKCIDSIIKQTYTPIEIILVDDGSTDGCYAICERYSNRYKNIIVIHKKNDGLGMARNTGIDNSTGKYIAFVDGDDFISENHIENLVDGCTNNRADASFGGYNQQCGDSFLKVSLPNANVNIEKPKIIKEMIPRMFGKLDYRTTDEIPMSVCMTVYSAEIIKRKNIRFQSEREFISEDLLFNIRFLKEANRVNLNKSCEYYYRFNNSSLTKDYQKDRLQKQILLTKRIVNEAKSLGIYDESEQRILSTFLSWVRNIVKSEQANYKNVGIVKSFKRIKEICNNQFVRWAIEKYDFSYLTKKPRLLNYLIKNKMVILIWISSFIKNKVNNRH